MDMYSTTALAAVIKRMIRPKSHFLNTAFPIISVQDTEEVFIDIEKSRRALAPFVSAEVAGQAVDQLGYETISLKPAYIKPTTVLKPSGTIKRRAGETIGGSDTPVNRRALILAETLLDHVDQITRRKEFMAAQILTTGKAIISGEKYQTRTIDFRRDADLTITLTGSDKWDQPDSDPIGDLEEGAERVNELEGVQVTDYTMDPVAWKAFKKNKDVREILDNRRALSGSAEFGGLRTTDGPVLAGTFGIFNVWVYSEYYDLTVNGVTTTYPLLPPGTVVGYGPDLNGIQGFGAILDEESLTSAELFANSWIERNPSRRLAQTQSSPLLVPGRRNGSVALKVL